MGNAYDPGARPAAMIAPEQRMRTWLPFGAPFLAAGEGLVVYIVSGVSIALAVVTVAAGGAIIAAAAWRRSLAPARTQLRHAVSVGLVAGLLATVAYDVTRMLLVIVARFAFWPFDTFGLFGRALLGTDARGPWVTATGTAFHLVNGLGFAVAYTICFGRRGILAGVAWAFVLELAMVSLYPGWLELKALNEFLSVSVVGHLAYGSVLGVVAQRLLQPSDGDSDAGNMG